MTEWIPVATVSEIAVDSAKECVVNGRIVALYRTADGYHAIDGICAHAGGPLADGTVAGCIVTCPWHGWQYDITTGISCLNAQIRQQSFNVRVEEDSIMVELP